MTKTTGKQVAQKTVAQKTEQKVDLHYRIWEGSVGICLCPQKKGDGSYFWKYALTRCYKERGGDQWRYDNYFSRLNDKAVALVLSKAAKFMDENDAGAYAAKQQDLAQAA